VRRRCIMARLLLKQKQAGAVAGWGGSAHCKALLLGVLVVPTDRPQGVTGCYGGGERARAPEARARAPPADGPPTGVHRVLWRR